MHKRMGHDVEIIASTETYVDQTKLGYVQPSSYMNCDGIWVHRLPYASWVPKPIRSKVRAYQGLWEKLTEFAPDLIFLHDIQFWDILTVRKYALQHKVPVRADGHTDFINSAKGLISKYVLHGMFYRSLIKTADPVIDKYFPTLPARGDFMNVMYGIAPHKMELLPFGFDDGAVSGLDRQAIRSELRKKHGIPDNDTVIVTGGKLDMRKNIHVLVERFSQLHQAGKLDGMHLVVFGKADPLVKRELDCIRLSKNVHMLGWVSADELFRVFWCGDLGFFPGTHSVVWEEAIAHGLGAVFHRWEGMQHLDLGGNAIFIDDAEPATLDQLLLDLVRDNKALVSQLGHIASTVGPEIFSFQEIAEKAIK